MMVIVSAGKREVRTGLVGLNVNEDSQRWLCLDQRVLAVAEGLGEG